MADIKKVKTIFSIARRNKANILAETQHYKGRLFVAEDTNELFNDNGTEIKKISNQVETMPTASRPYENAVVQYIGATTTTAPIWYHGYFYMCKKKTDGSYYWEELLSNKYKYTDNGGAILTNVDGQIFNKVVGGANAVRDITPEELDSAYANGKIYTVEFRATGKAVTTNDGTRYGSIKTTIIVDTSYYSGQRVNYVEIMQELTDLNGYVFRRKSERTKLTMNIENTIKFTTNWNSFVFDDWRADYIAYNDVWKAGENCTKIISQTTVRSGKRIWTAIYIQGKDMGGEGRKYMLVPNNLHGIKPAFTTSDNWWYPVSTADGTAAQNKFHDESRMFMKDGIGSIEMYQLSGGSVSPNVMLTAEWYEA